MKVRLSIELDLPNDTPVAASTAELLSDAYTNYVTQCHCRDALQWCAKGKIGSDLEDEGARKIYSFHDTWADICANAKWDFEVIK